MLMMRTTRKRQCQCGRQGVQRWGDRYACSLQHAQLPSGFSEIQTKLCVATLECDHRSGERRILIHPEDAMSTPPKQHIPILGAPEVASQRGAVGPLSAWLTKGLFPVCSFWRAPLEWSDFLCRTHPCSANPHPLKLPESLPRESPGDVRQWRSGPDLPSLRTSGERVKKTQTPTALWAGSSPVPTLHPCGLLMVLVSCWEAAGSLLA